MSPTRRPSVMRRVTRLIPGCPLGRPVVKKSRILDVDVAADVPYEETRLAKQAVRGRKRLVGVLLVGALVTALEGFVTRAPLMGIATLYLLAAAWGVHRGTLWGIVAAGLAGILATFVPLAAWATMGIARPDLIPALVAVVLGVATLPDVVLLARDAELQHAYGKWARRED